jgi:hypothetical protein
VNRIWTIAIAKWRFCPRRRNLRLLLLPRERKVSPVEVPLDLQANGPNALSKTTAIQTLRYTALVVTGERPTRVRRTDDITAELKGETIVDIERRTIVSPSLSFPQKSM